MSSTSAPLEPLVSAPSEAEATLLVNFLADRGIEAVAVGAFTAQFKASAPGEVQILVHRDELDRARSALAEVRPEPLPVPEEKPAAQESDYLSRLSGFGRVVAIVLLLGTAIGDVVCLVIAIRNRDFDYFLGSIMTAMMLVAILLLWWFGPRTTRS
jgi:hypothetical protein